MEFLAKIIPVALLVFVVSSMLAVGLSLTVGEIVLPLRNRRLVFLALLANFVLMPLAAFVIARLLQLAEPLTAAFEIMKQIASAISSGWIRRRSCVLGIMYSLINFSPSARTIGVSV